MQNKEKRFNTILQIVLNLAMFFGFRLISKISFKGIVIEKDEHGSLLYLEKNMLFFQIISILAIIALGITIFLLAYSLFKNIKYLENITVITNLIVLLFSIITLFIFPSSQDKRNSFSFSIAIASVVIITAIFIYKLGLKINNKSEKITIAVLAEGSILAALAIVLSLISKLIPFLEFPNGGSFSLSMLPLFIFGFRRGFKPGFIMGFVYSLINIITDVYIIHWGSIFFDYLIPFSILAAISGLFSKKALKGSYLSIILGVLLGGLFRYLMHGLSGVIFFKEYAGELNPWFYSFVFYNLPYMLVSTIGSLIVLLPLSKKLIFIETRIK